jgi:hypothetical protein
MGGGGANRWRQVRLFREASRPSAEFPDETVRQAVSALAELLLGILADDTTITPREEHDVDEDQS